MNKVLMIVTPHRQDLEADPQGVNSLVAQHCYSPQDPRCRPGAGECLAQCINVSTQVFMIYPFSGRDIGQGGPRCGRPGRWQEAFLSAQTLHA